MVDHYPNLNMGRELYQLVFTPSTLAEVPSTELKMLSLEEFQVYHNSVASQVKMKVSTFCQYINIFYISSFNAFETTEI
jgi:hypothetical protein